MSTATRPRSAAPEIEIANPLDYADEIKELFVAHGLPGFPDFFDRTYPAVVRAGGITWLGRDEHGRLIMHQACFPRRFQSARGQVVAGLMMNLMVAAQHRSFFPALGLLKRVLHDLEARGGFDFLYADPNTAGRVLLQAGRFTELGTLQRYVFPVSDRRAALDLCVRLYHAWLGGTDGAAAGTIAVPHAARGFPLEFVAEPRVPPPAVAAYHEPALYLSRLAGYPTCLDWWLTLHASHDPTATPLAALLVRGPDATGTATLKAVRRTAGVAPAAWLPGLIAALRQRGCTRLQISTLAESAFGRALRAAGFFPRDDRVSVFARALTAAGEACLRAVDDWEVTDLECDR